MTEIESGIAAFYEDFSSRIWLTYRKNFEEFKGSQVTTDLGWGCMIRSGQMLVANTLVQLELSRHWRKMDPSKSVHLAEDIGSESIHKNIIRLFGDSYENSPLSIHNIMDVAQETFSKKPGDWFGPSATGKSLSEALLFAEHDVYKKCSECQKQFLYTTCSPPGLSLEFSCIELVIQ